MIVVLPGFDYFVDVYQCMANEENPHACSASGMINGVAIANP